MASTTCWILRITDGGREWYLDTAQGWVAKRAKATLFGSRIEASRGWSKFTPTVAVDLIMVQVTISDGLVETRWPAVVRPVTASAGA